MIQKTDNVANVHSLVTVRNGLLFASQSQTRNLYLLMIANSNFTVKIFLEKVIYLCD